MLANLLLSAELFDMLAELVKIVVELAVTLCRLSDVLKTDRSSSIDTTSTVINGGVFILGGLSASNINFIGTNNQLIANGAGCVMSSSQITANSVSSSSVMGLAFSTIISDIGGDASGDRTGYGSRWTISGTGTFLRALGSLSLENSIINVNRMMVIFI